jgi:hypothetical protein
MQRIVVIFCYRQEVSVSQSLPNQMQCIDVWGSGKSHHVQESISSWDERQMGGIHVPTKVCTITPSVFAKIKTIHKMNKNETLKHRECGSHWFPKLGFIRVGPGNSRRCLSQTPYMCDQIHFGTVKEKENIIIDLTVPDNSTITCTSLQ